jgi:LacI family transcriptional regulator
MAVATIDDVAQLAGVSIKTVSRVVNREPNVRSTTREKVEAAIAELNYRPNKAARNLASHHSHLIALVYDDPSAYEIPSAGYVVNMQQGALAVCREEKYELLIHPCRFRDKDVGNELQALLEDVRPDGIILAAPLSNMPKIGRVIEATGIPLVRISPGDRSAGQPKVSTNDRAVSAEMTQYLASLGHSRIAFIKGHPSHKAVTNRFRGYCEGLEESGLKFSERLVVEGDNSIGSGEAAAKKLLTRKRRPTAIFAANDDMAAGVIRIADRLGIDVPGRLSVAGCDDIALAQQIYPALTTINQPMKAMTERATRSIIEMTRTGQIEDDSVIIPGTIVVRESTGPAPAD